MRHTKLRRIRKSCLVFCIFVVVTLLNMGCRSEKEPLEETSISCNNVTNVETTVVSKPSEETTARETTTEETTTSESIEETFEETSATSTIVETENSTVQTTSRSTEVTTVSTTSQVPVATTTRETTTQTTSSSYIPDSSHYISIATGIAHEYGCEVYVGADWSSYRNPIMLDSSLSDSTFETYVREVMQDLINRGNGYRNSFQVWVSDERESGNQTHGPGFYLYIG